MEQLVRTAELIVFGFIFVVALLITFAGDWVVEIDEAGRVIMLFIGLMAGGFLLDTVIIRWKQAKKELENTRKHGND